MSRTTGELVEAFAKALSLRDERLLRPFLSTEIVARFEETGALEGQRTVLDFWRRLFHTYSEIDIRIAKMVTDENLVVAELVYGLKLRRGLATSVRTISVFEIQGEFIVGWADHADLSEVSASERDLWRRLCIARW